jgi:hypothetical protein
MLRLNCCGIEHEGTVSVPFYFSWYTPVALTEKTAATPVLFLYQKKILRLLAASTRAYGDVQRGAGANNTESALIRYGKMSLSDRKT